jgi:hypothetical protein
VGCGFRIGLGDPASVGPVAVLPLRLDQVPEQLSVLVVEALSLGELRLVDVALFGGDVGEAAVLDDLGLLAVGEDGDGAVAEHERLDVVRVPSQDGGSARR